ncbi:hypothetical protein [Pseudomonas chlororaphis]|uniref:hypothetical protein n=1 Tax=Pseudomonas chlororaphis TaxID=587753 RepID=UPI0009BF54DB|nr:hypothetical protein [Pseudomonas chlororaphis]AZD01626.1 hypothetical protein C4K27_2432 [Pseudomonas chlororaphis subsp. chlororaphis]MBM0284728.1 hypothetical protein [Pseudomonas chlororaphis]MDO1508470.1 hypothetical protein [Pseudomonas chlororaphis]ORM49573.1 hypothetical protein B6D51_00060 [Pseudomonas chlororaphis subsp. chlororaphis]TWR98849.1 hypothetical protein FJD36_02470 [Pseudomonas chlororaphis subsp. chlororaphis]
MPRRRQPSLPSIIQIMKADFSFSADAFRMAPPSIPSDKYVMNINFAVACMIVVSFAIALFHT